MESKRSQQHMFSAMKQNAQHIILCSLFSQHSNNLETVPEQPGRDSQKLHIGVCLL